MPLPEQVIAKTDILIVDDTPDNLRLLSDMLSEQGYKVRKAINGSRALQAIDLIVPDLVLLDIMMPDMNGYEVCEKLKASTKTWSVPVIFISALDEVFDKVLAFDVGGADYIGKPFRVQEVLARVKHQLTIRHQQKLLQTQNEQLHLEICQREEIEAALQSYSQVLAQNLRASIANVSTTVQELLSHPNTLAEPSAHSPSTISMPTSVLQQIQASCEHQIDLIESLAERKGIQ